MDLSILWQSLGWPLVKLLFFVSLGLLVANFIEALNWTHKVARISGPLIRAGHLSDTVGGSFSMAFFSGVAANTMLAEAFDKGTIDKRELVLANLFNSLPTYFLHMPTVIFITVPLIKGAALIYVGLTFLAAGLRTGLIVVLSRILLQKKKKYDQETAHPENTRQTFQQALQKTWKRFQERIKKILLFTAPIYTIVFFLNRSGLFGLLEEEMVQHLAIFSWLNPQTMSIIVLHITAELTAGLAAAGALLDAGNLGYRDVILAGITLALSSTRR